MTRVVLALVAAAAFSVAVAPARALSPAVESHLPEITEHVVRGGATDLPGVACGAVCADIWDEEQRLKPARVSSAEPIQRAARNVRIGTKVLPPMSVLGRVTLSGTSFSIGWKVGGAVRTKLLKIGVPESPPLDEYFVNFHIDWLEQGAPIAHAGTAPVSAYYIHAYTSDGNTLNGFLRGNPALKGACATNYDHGGGPAWTDVITGSSACSQGFAEPLGYRDVHAYYRLGEDFHTPEPITDYSGQPFDKETTDWPDEPTSRADAEERTRRELERALSKPFVDLLDYLLGEPDACHPIDSNVCNDDPTDEERRRRCRPATSTPSGTDPDPNRPREQFAPEQYETHTGGFKRVPEGGVLPTEDAQLKYGWTRNPRSGDDWPGWGWRHVDAKHGWSEADIEATQDALARPPERVGGRLIYKGQEYPGLDGAWCQRRVVFGDERVAREEPEPKQIITSYGRWLRQVEIP